MAEVVKKQSQRMLALDILRGITIAGMILVNNPGSWSNMYAPLGHAPWHGLTPTDLIFPFFMFIMGISTFISLRKFEFKLSWPLFVKIIRRTVVIFAIGLAIAWFSKLCYGLAGGKSLAEAANSFSTLRILGVMPRLALCYGFASLIVLVLRCRHILWVIATLLLGYGVVLLCCNGLVFSEENIVSIIDRAVLGVDHMYKDTVDGVRLALDPEGLLSTIPSIAHVLIGFWAGMKMMEVKDINMRVNRLFIIGAILMFIGFLFDYAIPINKKLWTPTFAVVTCGLASTMLALLIWIIDIKGYKKWCRFFEAFGINPLFMYVLGGVLGILFATIKIGGTSIKSFIYNDFLVSVVGDATLASCLYAIIFIAINWCIGYVLYKTKL
jgi:predicted acyltransferase